MNIQDNMKLKNEIGGIGGIDINQKLQDLYKMPSRPICHILHDLEKITQLAKLGLDVVIPRVVFHMNSGRDICGHVLDIDSSEEEKVVLIYQLTNTSTENTRKSINTCFIPTSSIEALSVQDISTALHMLSLGNICTFIEGTPLSHLEIKRKLQAFSAFFIQELKMKVEINANLSDAPEDTLSCIHLMDLIRDSLLGLYLLAKENKQLTKLQKAVKSIFYKGGDSNTVNVELSKNTLTISAPLKSETFERKRPIEISQLIETSL